MAEPALWALSISAFSAVILLLSLLAVGIFLLTLIFPAPPPAPPTAGRAMSTDGDAAFEVAAIQAAVSHRWPGAHVRHIEERHQGA